MTDESVLREFAAWVLKQERVEIKFYDRRSCGFYSPTAEQLVKAFKTDEVAQMIDEKKLAWFEYPTMQEWISAHPAGADMIWKSAAREQFMFLRDSLAGLLGATGRVISTHRSKSIELPVVEFERKDLGLRVILRENFYNWKMSVISERPIEADFAGLFYIEPPREPDYTGDHLHSVYFEGFPRDLIFGYYSQSKQKFSAELYGDHALWAALYSIRRALGDVRDRRYHTRDEHRKELDESSARWKARLAKDTELEKQTAYLLARPRLADYKPWPDADILLLQVAESRLRLASDAELSVKTANYDWWRIGHILAAADTTDALMVDAATCENRGKRVKLVTVKEFEALCEIAKVPR